MPGSLRLFKVAGISIEINVSWLIVLALLTASLAMSWFPVEASGYPVAVYWTLGLVAALLLFASVLAHELAHSLVARARGLPVKSVTLFIFGGVSDLEREPKSAGVEFQMALVGPLTSVIIGALALGVWLLLGTGYPLASAFLLYLGAANVFLGVFNLIPGFPLDGGRVLRSIIWKATGNLRTATRWASGAGQVVALLIILAGIWLFFSGDLFDGLWMGFIGWFLLQAAREENTQVALETLFKGVSVGQLMSAPPLTAQGDIPLQRIVDDYVLPYGARSIPILHGDILIGLLTLSDIRRVPRDRWPWTPVGTAMTPRERLQVARTDESLNDALPRLARSDVNQLPVVDGAGRLVGILSRDQIVRYLEVRRGLGLDEERRTARPESPAATPAAPAAPPSERMPVTP